MDGLPHVIPLLRGKETKQLFRDLMGLLLDEEVAAVDGAPLDIIRPVAKS
jgi:hypothetical protein